MQRMEEHAMTHPRATWTVTSVCAVMLSFPLAVPGGGNPEAGAQAQEVSPPGAVARRADLIVHLAGPASARPGEAIGERIRLAVTNAGAATAWGARDHPSGFMIDLTLGRDTRLAVGFKAYSPHYVEDVLLEGGRVSATADLAPAATRRYAVIVVIPADVPAGLFHLCAYVDAGNAVAESDEGNNTACTPLRIVPARSTNQRSTDEPPNGGAPPPEGTT
jgi:hypothetical protein